MPILCVLTVHRHVPFVATGLVVPLAEHGEVAAIEEDEQAIVVLSETPGSQATMIILEIGGFRTHDPPHIGSRIPDSCMRYPYTDHVFQSVSTDHNPRIQGIIGYHASSFMTDTIPFPPP